MKFLSSITIAILAVVATTACSEDYACPGGTESRNGRCRLMVPDAGPEAFAWPPADAGADLGRPSPYTGPAPTDAMSTDSELSDAGPASEVATPADGAAVDIEPQSDTPPSPPDVPAAAEDAGTSSDGAGPPPDDTDAPPPDGI